MKTFAAALIAASAVLLAVAPSWACPATGKSSASLTDSRSYDTAQKDQNSSSQTR